ncbi:ImmA/IrrE family metallo-endopeptidase [Glutamicibacter protophormiae]|uniref:ImmA/IrrE family metallo-endopeptidase n=1 Tax=Glutamicibacter protophormiae TaxID=37930 RepID=UPI003A938AC6
MGTTKCQTNLNEIAQEFGVHVRSAPTPGNLWGIYDKRHKLITIKPGLGRAQYRSTLAHELGHAHYGHSGHHRKTERLADKWAAKKLLTVESVLDAARYSNDTGALAAHLEVMPWVLETFVDTLNARQAVFMMNQAAEFLA